MSGVSMDVCDRADRGQSTDSYRALTRMKSRSPKVSPVSFTRERVYGEETKK